MPAASSVRPSRLVPVATTCPPTSLRPASRAVWLTCGASVLRIGSRPDSSKAGVMLPPSAVGPNVTSGRSWSVAIVTSLSSAATVMGAVIRSAAALAAVASSVLTVGSTVVVTRSASTSAGASNEDRAVVTLAIAPPASDGAAGSTVDDGVGVVVTDRDGRLEGRHLQPVGGVVDASRQRCGIERHAGRDRDAPDRSPGVRNGTVDGVAIPTHGHRLGDELVRGERPPERLVGDDHGAVRPVHDHLAVRQPTVRIEQARGRGLLGSARTGRPSRRGRRAGHGRCTAGRRRTTRRHRAGG